MPLERKVRNLGAGWLPRGLLWLVSNGSGGAGVAGGGAGAGAIRAWGWLWLFPSLVVRVVRVVVAAERETVKSARFLVLLALK
jgi:hypothetical protein